MVGQRTLAVVAGEDSTNVELHYVKQIILTMGRTLLPLLFQLLPVQLRLKLLFATLKTIITTCSYFHDYCDYHHHYYITTTSTTSDDDDDDDGNSNNDNDDDDDDNDN